jgi:hypothetical protein
VLGLRMADGGLLYLLPSAFCVPVLPPSRAGRKVRLRRTLVLRLETTGGYAAVLRMTSKAPLFYLPASLPYSPTFTNGPRVTNGRRVPSARVSSPRATRR